MKYPFQIHDGIVELLRCQARYTDRETGAEETWGFPTKAQAEKAVEDRGVDGQGTLSEVDVSAVAWMDGMAVDSFDAALVICELGEDAYRAKLAEYAQKSPDRLRADVDFISAMTGVELV